MKRLGSGQCMDKEKIKLLKILDRIEHKPIFKCINQSVKYQKKKYLLPKCVAVELTWEDWMDLRHAIHELINKRC